MPGILLNADPHPSKHVSAPACVYAVYFCYNKRFLPLRYCSETTLLKFEDAFERSLVSPRH